ncbi:MAG: hypothetical protein ACR2IF_03880 [Terriglobales bacterium]
MTFAQGIADPAAPPAAASPAAGTSTETSAGLSEASSSASTAALPAAAVAPVLLVTPDPHRISQQCRAGVLPRKKCKPHWFRATFEGTEFMFVLAGGTIWPEDRRMGLHGRWLDKWLDSASNFRFGRWSQDSPRTDTWLGHPLMGAISNAQWYANDPLNQTVEWGDKAYWKSRLRALPYNAFWQFAWKLGPISESSVGNYGLFYWYNPELHVITNDTGMAPIVTGVAVGFGWSVGEDLLDRYAIRRLDRKSRNPVYLLLIQMLNPARGFANVLHFKAPWYRDDRDVKANWSFHSSPRER